MRVESKNMYFLSHLKIINYWSVAFWDTLGAGMEIEASFLLNSSNSWTNEDIVPVESCGGGGSDILNFFACNKVYPMKAAGDERDRESKVVPGE